MSSKDKRTTNYIYYGGMKNGKNQFTVLCS